MTLRHVRLSVSARGHRTQTITLVTTLLDPLAYPLPQLGELYFQRWSVELHFREIKITLGMDVLRCQTPEMVEKEVTMHSVSYNLVRALMQEAAIRHQVDLTRISFKGTSIRFDIGAQALKPREACHANNKHCLMPCSKSLPTILFHTDQDGMNRARKSEDQRTIIF